MRPPLRLDIGWLDLALAGLWGVSASDHLARTLRVEARWGQRAFACLSVRTGLDAYLTELALPEGSEVLVSGYTIPDMVTILEHHKLVPVPLDLDLATLAPTVDALRGARTERTCAILVAHLFGSRIELEPIVEFARAHDLRVLEDGAQVFGTSHYRGHPDADLSMFSFGTIKTATALGGAILNVRDDVVREAMVRAREAQPLWPRAAFLKKTLKASVMKLLSYEPTYSACVALCQRLGLDHEDKLHRSARGFDGDLIEAIRFAPNAPVLALLDWRLRTYPDERIAQRERVAREAIEQLPETVHAVGESAPEHTHWVLAVICDEPDRLVAHLREHGLDATRAATVTAVCEKREAQPGCAKLRDSLVYVPSGPELDAVGQARLAAAFASYAPSHRAALA